MGRITERPVPTPTESPEQPSGELREELSTRWQLFVFIWLLAFGTLILVEVFRLLWRAIGSLFAAG